MAKNYQTFSRRRPMNWGQPPMSEEHLKRVRAAWEARERAEPPLSEEHLKRVRAALTRFREASGG
jgi:hypothetical protein